MSNSNLIHLVRHGQFVKSTTSGDGELTPLGSRQARYTAKRLRECCIKRVYSSNLQRAEETTAIIIEQLPDVSVSSLPLLREMLPTRVDGLHVPLDSRRKGQKRIEDIMSRFFSRPPRSGDTLLVCHGNLIRALLCRMLDTPVTKWQELAIFHCGITTFGFREGSRISLHCFNDSGHLPSELRTRT